MLQRQKDINSELENAFNKELSLIKNDLYYQQIEVKRDAQEYVVRFDIFYKPMEILAGDTYSLRKTKDGRVIFFLLDAMGKGVSASLTATTSTTLLNYIFDQMQRTDNFVFEFWLKRYMDYTIEGLLENEMLSGLFACYNRHDGSLKYASFGMPAMLMIDANFKLHTVKSNNIPINKFMRDWEIDIIDVAGIRRALFYTDGLCESQDANGKFYKTQMYKDFQESINISDFTQRVYENIPTGEDDLSFIFVESLDQNFGAKKKTILATREAVDETLMEISEYARCFSVSPKKISELTLALSELLANAMEHGVFGINNKMKHMLIANGELDDRLNDYEKKFVNRSIDVHYYIKDEGKNRVFIARIHDHGEGFDTKILRDLVIDSKNFNGRGIMIVKKLIDRFYYNEKGNAITIRKYLD